jgi:hypothetical protein
MISFISENTLNQIVEHDLVNIDEIIVFEYATYGDEYRFHNDASILNPFKFDTQTTYGMISDVDDCRFDLWYKQCLDLNKDQRELLFSIMLVAAQGANIFLVNNFMDIEVMMNAVESFIVYVKEIYGYHINIVKELEDYDESVLVEGKFNKIGQAAIDSMLYILSHPQ